MYSKTDAGKLVWHPVFVCCTLCVTGASAACLAVCALALQFCCKPAAEAPATDLPELAVILDLAEGGYKLLLLSLDLDSLGTALKPLQC